MNADYKLLLVLMAMTAIFLYAIFAPRAEANPDYITCRNNAGEVIHVAPPHLCPPGYWQL